MSCRHSLALETCRECYPATGTIVPDNEGTSLDGPGAVPARDVVVAADRVAAEALHDEHMFVNTRIDVADLIPFRVAARMEERARCLAILARHGNTPMVRAEELDEIEREIRGDAAAVAHLLDREQIVDALSRVHWRNGAWEKDHAAVVTLAHDAVDGTMDERTTGRYALDRLVAAARALGLKERK